MVIAGWYSTKLRLKLEALVNLFEGIVLITYRYLTNLFKGCFFKKSREMNGFVFLHFHLNGKIKISNLEFLFDH